MINSKIFFKGLKSLIGIRSPAIPLAACFVALGALLKDAGFNLQQSAASSFFTYALPGQLVMAESLLIGASLLNIFIAVWLVNFRLYPMTVSLFPLLKHKSQPKWKYYLSCHFLAVSSWLIAKDSYKKIVKKHRLDFWIGIGIGTWTTAILTTLLGYLMADFLSKDLMIGLAIVNPVYFFCMMIGAMKNFAISLAVVGGTLFGPTFYLISTEWAVLIAGLSVGTIAYIFERKNGSK
jgi:predicted branched-subunit amino acid permease|tara:strand:+ start:318 stop:1025 length:708 start_codon:yes stop_codon:yes gene_type:complete